jgi:hypothetical protein
VIPAQEPDYVLAFKKHHSHLYENVTLLLDDTASMISPQ